jgi:hypothetical protein
MMILGSFALWMLTQDGDEIARRLTIYVYLKDDYVTGAAALGDRYKGSTGP